jgi:hypothetical protein
LQAEAARFPHALLHFGRRRHRFGVVHAGWRLAAVAEDVPAIFWRSDNRIFGSGKRLQGVQPGPNQDIWWNIHEWALTE